RSFMADRSEWEGKPSELLEQLNHRHTENAAVKDRARWPKTPRGLSGHLRRLAPALSKVGLGVAFNVGPDRRYLRLSAVKAGDQRAPRVERVSEGCLPALPRAHWSGDVRTSETRCASEIPGPDATGARPTRCARSNPIPTGDPGGGAASLDNPGLLPTPAPAPEPVPPSAPPTAGRVKGVI